MRWINIILILNIVVTLAHSKDSIQGIITDVETKSPLPYANVYVKDTYNGTTSNSEGRYSLEISSLPATVVISYIGYESKKIVLDVPGENNLDITLKPIVLEMGSIVISASRKDVANEIMKKVIARKIRWKHRLESYRAKAYTRVRIENDSSIVSMSESVSKLYWSIHSGSHEEFIAKKSSKRMPYLTEMNVGSKNILNFYDDDITLMNHTFIGPTHPDALKYYEFELTGIRYLHNSKISDLKVRPKSRLQPLFSGTISVLEADSAMIEVDVCNSGNISFSTMLNYFRGNYKQQFSNFGKEFWLPIDSRSEETIEVDMGLFSFPRGTLSKISVISHYQINVDVFHDISRIEAEASSHTPSSSLQSDTSVFHSYTRVPLTARELRAYTSPDTTMTFIKSFPPKGILAPYLKRREDEIETTLREQSNYDPIQTSTKFGFEAWYNRVEGLHAGIKYNRSFFNMLHVSVTGGYQTYSGRFFHETRFRYRIFQDDRYKYFYANYADKTVTRYPSEHYPQWFASFLPLFGKYDYYDYSLTREFRSGFRYGMHQIKTDLALGFRIANDASISKTSNCTLLNRNFSQRNNLPIDEGRLNSVRLHWSYDASFGTPKIERMIGLTSRNQISLEIEHSSSNFFDSDFDFTKYTFLLDYTLNILLRRRPDPGYLRARFEASTFTGNLPLQRHSIIDGSLFSYSPFGIFKSLKNRPLEGEKKLALFWEYNFRSIPFEILGLKYFKKNKYEWIIHGASGRTWIEKNKPQNISQMYIPSYVDEYHHELGVSIRMKFRFIAVRLDGTQNMNNNAKYFGFSLHLIALTF